MKKTITLSFIAFIALILIFTVHGSVLKVQALTEPQIDSILSLLTSFGVDSTTLNNVESALRGTFSSSSGTQATFTRNLSLGDEGEDVRQLQIALNTLPCCLISTTGTGSRGQETNFFGSKTSNAVTRFQNTYRSEVLTPNGLLQGTGYFGSSTRAKLNELVGSSQSSTTQTNTTQNVTNGIPPTTTTTTPPVVVLAPKITGISPTSGRDGTEITITGTGFSTTTNKVLTGFNLFEGVVSVNGTLKVIIDSKIPNNVKKYHLPIDTFVTVETGGKKSNSVPFTLTGDSISNAKKEEYKNKILDKLNLPADILASIAGSSSSSSSESSSGSSSSGSTSGSAGSTILTPVGGPISEVSYECCYGHIVTIDNAVTNQSVELMYYPGISTLYSYYMIFLSGPNTIGNYFPIGLCLDSDEECESISTTDGTILNVGTSLIGS